jgi:hypothetical protein
MIKLTKKAIELLDAVTSVPYSRNGLGYTIGFSAVLPFTCYSYWFSWYFDQRGKTCKSTWILESLLNAFDILNLLDIACVPVFSFLVFTIFYHFGRRNNPAYP